jgi:hypothetical protein
MTEVNINKGKVFSKDIRRKLSISHGGTGILKEELLISFCKCGCGNYTKPGNKFIIGHNQQGKKQSDEEKQKRAISLSKSWANDFKRKKEQSERMSGDNNPAKKLEVREKISIKGKGKILSQEQRKINKEAQLKYWNEHPEKKKEHSNAMKKRWQKKEFQEKWKSKMKLVYKSVEVRNKIRAASERLWKTEDYINKHSGVNNPNWRGGISGEDLYGKNWKEGLKETIRKRDDYKCQECFTFQNQLSRKLHVHHIDYDKENCNSNNLISLCHSCHTKTNNKNREKWTKNFKLKMFVKLNNMLVNNLPVHTLNKQAA